MNAKNTKTTSAPSERGTDWEALKNLTDEDILSAIASDPSAAPVLTREWFEQAERVQPGQKRPIYIRFDREVLDYFQHRGMGYQSRMNAVLLHYVRTVRALDRAIVSRPLAKQAERIEQHPDIKRRTPRG